MADGSLEGFLGSAYAANSPRAVSRVYDRWADTYDDDMTQAGYQHPAVSLDVFHRHLPPTMDPVLDAGVGTGILGQSLASKGYSNVCGVDISMGMLVVAANRHSYENLIQADVTRLPFVDAAFAGVISTGVFTTGHVGVKGLDELLRVTQAGGVIVLTVKSTLWETEIDERISDLESIGRIRVLELTTQYVSMPSVEATLPSLCLAIGVLSVSDRRNAESRNKFQDL